MVMRLIIGSRTTAAQPSQKNGSVYAVRRSTRRDYNSRAKVQNVRAGSSAGFITSTGSRRRRERRDQLFLRTTGVCRG